VVVVTAHKKNAFFIALQVPAEGGPFDDLIDAKEP
jgi:hypothetical protein